MSRFALSFHLMCAIIASFTCVLWSVITVLVVFVWHTAGPNVRLLIPIAVLGGGALMEFRFYREAAAHRSPMDTNSQNPTKREVVVDGDWISAAAMALLLLFALLTAIADVRAVLHGHVQQVSYSTVILALCAIYFAVFSRFGKLFRAGTAALGIGTTIRAVAHYFGRSTDVPAGISGLVFSIFASILILVATVQWFRQVVHLDRRSS